MKTKQTIICGLLAVMYALSLGACSGGEQKLTGPTDSFKFQAVDSGWAVYRGTATEGTVNIPAYYRTSTDYDYLPVTAISSGAFAGCTNLTKITIPASVTEIGSNAFNRCTSLASITIPTSVTEIGSYAFADCTGLTSITIPESVTDIGSGVFSGWTASQTIKVQGKANEAVADSAWGSGWRSGCDAKIVYQR